MSSGGGSEASVTRRQTALLVENPDMTIQPFPRPFGQDDPGRDENAGKCSEVCFRSGYYAPSAPRTTLPLDKSRL